MSIKSLIFTVIFAFLPLTSWAASQTAASCSRADVVNAYNAASAGDTVNIPAGSCTWTSTFTISKSVTLKGAGVASTIITMASSTKIIDISLSSDVPVRITGIRFEKGATNNQYGVYVSGKTNNSFPYSQIRIDNNYFNGGSDQLWVRGWVYGVIDHNTFNNYNVGLRITGDENHSWNRSIEAGTINAVIIEDNTFTIDNTPTTVNNSIYQQQGARSVIRYNTFDSSGRTGGVGASLYHIDSHGNQNYYSEGAGFRGQPIVEIYNNAFNCYNDYDVIGLRSGSVLIHNNTITSVSGTPDIQFTEEEAWSTSHFPSGLDSAWPAEDQHTNSFIWNNTVNGSPVTGIALGSGADSTFIQKDRDYFMHAPEAGGGYTYHDNRLGAAGNDADGTLNWNGAHANAYYPYTPYTYPHPLTTTPRPPVGDN